MEANAKTKVGKRSYVGIVTSDKMDKTIVVAAKFKEKHPNGPSLQKICNKFKEV